MNFLLCTSLLMSVLDRALLFLPFYLLFIYLQFSMLLKKRLKILKILVLFLFFIDNGLFIAQNNSLYILNSNLFCSYWIMSLLLEQFDLAIEYGKTEVFHFSRTHSIFNPPPLDLSILGGPIL